MSFSFGFGGDDIESGNDDHNTLTQQVECCEIHDDNDVAPIQPKKHTLQELVSCLSRTQQALGSCSYLNCLPSQISYNLLPIPKRQQQDSSATPDIEHLVPRRSVFDIRTQLMAEANADENDNDTLLAGLERGDLTSSIYEGGFKTWECSLDLASLAAGMDLGVGNLHIIELGAGSAVPSLTALQRILIKQRTAQRAIHFTLCDYNEDVLKLATAPNIFLVSELCSSIKRERSGGNNIDNQQTLAEDDQDVEDIDSTKISTCITHLTQSGVSIDFISGAWGPSFLDLLPKPLSNSSSPIPPPQPPPHQTLILASETIYSPKSTPTFTFTLLQLLRQDPGNSKAWVAAKKVYFGVGGGVDDFVDQVERQGGRVTTLLDVQGVGVGRVVLEITVQ